MSGKLPDSRRWQGWGERVFVDTQVVERCAFCSFEVVASFEQARQAFEQHKCDRPRPAVTQRRRSGFAIRARVF